MVCCYIFLVITLIFCSTRGGDCNIIRWAFPYSSTRSTSWSSYRCQSRYMDAWLCCMFLDNPVARADVRPDLSTSFRKTTVRTVPLSVRAPGPDAHSTRRNNKVQRGNTEQIPSYQRAILSFWLSLHLFFSRFLIGPVGELKMDVSPAQSLEDCLSATLSTRDVPSAAAFIRACLTLDPEERLDAHALIGHEWVQQGTACDCEWCVVEK